MMCEFPISIRAPNNGIGYDTQFIAVPCGKCWACMRKKSTDWYIRLKEESRVSIANCFVTLTYNDDNKKPEGVDKEDLQLFFKRLRKLIHPDNGKIRYYAISEYGPKTYRPHYHIMFFNLDSFCYLRSTKKKEQRRLTQQELEKIWGNGFVKIMPLNQNNLRYIAENHMLKHLSPDGQNKNFMLCSKGIGKAYMEINKRFHSTPEHMFYSNGDYKLGLPNYYKRKLYEPHQIKQKHEEILSKEETPLTRPEKFKDGSYYRERRANFLAGQERYIKRKIEKKKL